MSKRQQFIDQGIFTVEGAVPADALHWTHQAAESYLAEQLASENPATGVGIQQQTDARHIIALDRAIPHLGAVALYLMGLPAVTEAARAACGPEAVCTHDWLVVKNAGDGFRVGWHQDFVHDGRFTAINVGIHLDDAREDAVRFIPGVRRGAEDIGALRERYDDHSPELLTAEVAAGGLTVHDVLLVHGSPPLEKQRRRKTLYLEFRDPAMLVDHPNFTPDYLALRRRAQETARRLAERLGDSPSGDPDELLNDEERALITEVKAARPLIEPANYGYLPPPHS